MSGFHRGAYRLPFSGTIPRHEPFSLDEFAERKSRRVLRLKKGDLVWLLDSTGVYRKCICLGFNQKRRLRFQATAEVVPGREPSPLLLALPPIRDAGFETLLRQTSEIGIEKVQCIRTRFSRTPKPAGETKISRWNRLLLSSALQSGRSRPVALDVNPITLPELLERETERTVVVLDSTGSPFSDSTEFRQNLSFPLLVLLGPEGGWSDEEREFFKKRNLFLFSLGDTTLKTDTAAVSSCFFLLRILNS